MIDAVLTFEYVLVLLPSPSPTRTDNGSRPASPPKSPHTLATPSNLDHTDRITLGWIPARVYQTTISSVPLCLVTTFGAKDEFEDVSDDDVALLVPIGELEDGARGGTKCGADRPGSWAYQ